MPSIEQYFAALAKFATEELAANLPPGSTPAVFDGPQDPAATAWSALAVHPMNVMETSYVAQVHAAEDDAGDDPVDKREAAFDTLSRFFALHKDAPTRLHPDSTPLIDEGIEEIKTDFRQIQVLALQDPGGSLLRLTRLIDDVGDLLFRITTPQSVSLASADIQEVAVHLDFATTPRGQIGANWAAGRSATTPAEAQAIVDEVESQIMDPLTRPSIAAASPRSLYNIGPFTLFRLMHRFLGGSPDIEMTLDQKGKASGDVTGRMHRRDWGWMAQWHQDRIHELMADIDTLNTRLAVQFHLPGGTDVLRFFLKGGRAMFTMLGEPEKGTNDWDTGIMINPDIAADDWYVAFAQVNDLVVHFLDRARFSYTELLQQHQASLLDPIPVQATLQATQCCEGRLQNGADPSATRRFSLRALQQEHLIEGQVRLSNANGAFRPSGVNGELIDIGISARNSVELLEHWRTLEVAIVDGVGGVPTPVPTLLFFVEDFSTMIREAIMTNTVDRKLAKRLERLLFVFRSDNAAFRQEVQHRIERVERILPQSAQHLSINDGSVGNQMLAWGLVSLLESLEVFFLRDAWCAAFDSFILAQADRLFNPQQIAPMWAEVQPSIKDHGNDAECQALLMAQNAVAEFADCVLQDHYDKVDFASGTGRDAVKALLGVIDLPFRSPKQGVFYRTGLLALENQAAHARIDLPQGRDRGFGGALEVFYRPKDQPTLDMLTALSREAAPAIPVGYAIDIEQFDDAPALVLRVTEGIAGLNIAPAAPALLVIREEPVGAGTARVLDCINNAHVASVRDLTRLYAQRAGQCDDFRLRTAGKSVRAFLLDDLLGRQLHAI